MADRDDRRAYLARRLRAVAHEFASWREPYAQEVVIALHYQAHRLDNPVPPGAVPAAPAEGADTDRLRGPK